MAVFGADPKFTDAEVTAGVATRWGRYWDITGGKATSGDGKGKFLKRGISKLAYETRLRDVLANQNIPAPPEALTGPGEYAEPTLGLEEQGLRDQSRANVEREAELADRAAKLAAARDTLAKQEAGYRAAYSASATSPQPEATAVDESSMVKWLVVAVLLYIVVKAV